MYDSIILTLILITLVWIAASLHVVASGIRILGRMFKRDNRKITYLTNSYARQLERNNMPWIAKMVVVKVLSHIAIRYVSKKMR